MIKSNEGVFQMQRSLWLGLMLMAMGTTAFADPQAKVRKVSDQENSYTYYNWKPNRAKPQPAAPAPAASPAPAAAPTTSGYTPIRPTPALLNPAAAGGYSDPGVNAPPPQQMAPPAYYGPGPQTYFSDPYFANGGFYSSGYAYPGLQVSNNGFFTGLSLSGIYRNGNVTIRAGNPGFYGPGFRGGGYNGFQGGGYRGFCGGGFNGGASGGFRGGFIPVR